MIDQTGAMRVENKIRKQGICFQIEQGRLKPPEHPHGLKLVPLSIRHGSGGRKA